MVQRVPPSWNTTETPHFNDLSCPVDGSFIEKDTAIRTEMFLHRIKVFTQSKIVLIFSDFFLLSVPKPPQQNAQHSRTRSQ